MLKTSAQRKNYAIVLRVVFYTLRKGAQFRAPFFLGENRKLGKTERRHRDLPELQ
ncbi:hypothetical protein XNC3_1220002 [Xenorhabdus nematophila F1]|nr:hypothetical protein XNC3_1220002 [Xenorhabdus nematophila F1]